MNVLLLFGVVVALGALDEIFDNEQMSLETSSNIFTRVTLLGPDFRCSAGVQNQGLEKAGPQSHSMP